MLPQTSRIPRQSVEFICKSSKEELQTLAQPTCESEHYDGIGLDKVRGTSVARGRMGNFSRMVPGGFNCGETAFLGTSPLYDTSPSNSLHDFMKLRKTILQIIHRKALC